MLPLLSRLQHGVENGFGALGFVRGRFESDLDHLFRVVFKLALQLSDHCRHSNNIHRNTLLNLSYIDRYFSSFPVRLVVRLSAAK